MQWAPNAELKRWAPLVKRCAKRLAARLPTNVEIDDLVQAGMLGLNEALQRFDGAAGFAFEAYALPRVRGAMLELLRQADPLTRGQRRLLREREAVQRRLEHQLGRAPRQSELAAAMGVSVQALRELSELAIQVVDIEDQAEIVGGHCPSQDLERVQEESAAALRIAALPEKEWYAMSQTLCKGRTLSAIGADLRVTEARASQLISSAASRLTVVEALTDPKREAKVKRAAAVDLSTAKPVVPPPGPGAGRPISKKAQAWQRLDVGMAYELSHAQAERMAKYAKTAGGRATVRKHPDKPGVYLLQRLQ